MSDPVAPDEGSGSDGPKRKGRTRKKHTVAKVVLAVAVALSIVTGLGVIYFYRHLNGNLTVISINEALGDDRPEKRRVEGPQEPLNILGRPPVRCKHQTGLSMRASTGPP